jgi:hypothetical protein
VSDAVRSVRVRRTRSRRRRRVRRTVLILAMAGFVYLAAWCALSVRSSWSARASLGKGDAVWVRGNLSQNLALLAAKSVSPSLALPRRVVYPYSVVPGGVQTPEDLRQVSDHDSVVGSHYAGFDFRSARVVELDQPKLVYLSYRMGNRVFWTAKRISLHKGEKLITDGRMTARTRCANQISESPQPAVSPPNPLRRNSRSHSTARPDGSHSRETSIPWDRGAVCWAPLALRACRVQVPHPFRGEGFHRFSRHRFLQRVACPRKWQK